jgi:hypothetical protein
MFSPFEEQLTPDAVSRARRDAYRPRNSATAVPILIGGLTEGNKAGAFWVTCLDKLVHFIIEKLAKERSFERSFEMKKCTHTKARIFGVLRQLEAGQTVKDVARELGVRRGDHLRLKSQVRRHRSR